MSETTVPTEATATEPTQADAEAATPTEPVTLDLRGMLEAGAHFGHQTRRWNPKMRGYIFGERHGIHILDLDQSYPMFRDALDFLRELVGEGGKVLFVGTKKQAAASIMSEAVRAKQYYVNNRWLGGMLTNWKTVKKSIDRYKSLIEELDNEEKRAEYSKKVLAGMTRQRDKYAKSLAGMREMTKLPDAVFMIDVMKESIAVTEARRLGIPIVAIVDSNCNPDGIDFVVPGNDDALRAIGYYCALVAEACIEGSRIHQEKLVSQPEAQAATAADSGAPSSGRRVVEISQPPRRGRGQTGGTSGRTATAGGWSDKPVEDAAAAPAAEAPKEAAAPKEAEAAKEAEAPAAESTPEAATPEKPTEAPAS